jgi:hypothetical protein
MKKTAKFQQRLTTKLVVLAGAILLSMQVTYADDSSVLYREIFGNTPGASGSQPNTNFDSVGWSGYWSPTAQNELAGSVTTPTTNYNNFGVSDSWGVPETLTNINTGIQNVPPASTTNGFAFSSGFLSVSNNLLIETSLFNNPISDSNIGSISFYSGNTSNSFPNGMPGWRIAVEVENQWYVSDQVLVQTINIANAGAFSNSTQKLVLNWVGAAWDLLTFVPGSALAISNPAALPVDTLQACGLYSDPAVNTNGVPGVATRRFDTYEIDVPEPSSVALVFMGLGALWGLCRSRKA